MNRRDFVKTSVMLSSAPILMSAANASNKSPVESKLKGFIFSDAHIGWKGKHQPSLDEQKKAIDTIRAKFTDLDLLFDTGDIHHGYLNETQRDQARDFWLSEMVSPFSEALFSYIPGNHELGKGPRDEEITAAQLGSQNLRPYYSFDCNGVHFISLPQLLDTVLVTQESLNWLSHDLWLNKDKTTLIFSHNSIKGTTFDNGETGYRVVVNSDKLLEVINKHNNVIAWLHGHNHQYEIVKKHNRLYVSNGRIGGFSPPKSWGEFGQGHLGGIFFEIDESGLTVKCFSATNNQFFDEFGFPHLTKHLSTATSFNPKAGYHYYCGHGQLTDNVKHRMANHFLTDKKVQISTRVATSEVLNENNKFQMPTDLYFSKKKIKRVIGYQVLPKSLSTTKTEKGLEIRGISDGSFQVNIPTLKRTKGMVKRGSYFRCESGDVMVLKAGVLKNEALTKASKIKVLIYVFDKNQKVIHKSGQKEKTLHKENGVEIAMSIPQLNQSDSEKYIRAMVQFSGMGEKVTITELSLVKRNDFDGNQSITLDGADAPVEQKLKAVNSASTFGEIKYRGVKPVSTVLKYPEIKWHIRNAEGEMINGAVFVKKWRHRFQTNNAVILTPLGHHKDFYLNKTVDLMGYKVTHANEHIKVELSDYKKTSVLIFKSNKTIKKVLGSNQFHMAGQFLHVIPADHSIEVFI